MTWMKHAETDGIADLPDLPYWRARGWEPTDERPAEPDTLHDPPEDPAPEIPESPEDSSGLSTAQPENQRTEDVEGDVTHG